MGVNPPNPLQFSGKGSQIRSGEGSNKEVPFGSESTKSMKPSPVVKTMAEQIADLYAYLQAT